MGALPIPAYDDSRNGPYIDELHDFLNSYELAYGSPIDLLTVADRIEMPGPFAGDLNLVLRSILYREGRSMSRPELLGLLAIAIGGPAMDRFAFAADGPRLERPPQQCWQALSRIYSFVNEVRRRPLNPTANGGQLVPFPSAVLTAEPERPEPPPTPVVQTVPDSSALESAVPAPGLHAALDAETAESVPVPAAAASRPPAPQFSPAESADLMPEPWPSTSTWLRILLIAVAGALLIAAFLVFVLQPKTSGHVRPKSAPVSTSTPIAHVPKPSAYGEAFLPTPAPGRRHSSRSAAKAEPLAAESRAALGTSAAAPPATEAAGTQP